MGGTCPPIGWQKKEEKNGQSMINMVPFIESCQSSYYRRRHGQRVYIPFPFQSSLPLFCSCYAIDSFVGTFGNLSVERN